MGTKKCAYNVILDKYMQFFLLLDKLEQLGIIDTNQKYYLKTTMEYLVNSTSRKWILISALPPCQYIERQICIATDITTMMKNDWRDRHFQHSITRSDLAEERQISAAEKRLRFWCQGPSIRRIHILANIDCGRKYDNDKQKKNPNM